MVAVWDGLIIGLSGLPECTHAPFGGGWCPSPPATPRPAGEPDPEPEPHGDSGDAAEHEGSDSDSECCEHEGSASEYSGYDEFFEEGDTYAEGSESEDYDATIGYETGDASTSFIDATDMSEATETDVESSIDSGAAEHGDSDDSDSISDWSRPIPYAESTGPSTGTNGAIADDRVGSGSQPTIININVQVNNTWIAPNINIAGNVTFNGGVHAWFIPATFATNNRSEDEVRETLRRSLRE